MYIQVTHCASLLCRDELAIEGCLQLQQLLLETPILISDGYICMHVGQPRQREGNGYHVSALLSIIAIVYAERTACTYVH